MFGITKNSIFIAHKNISKKMKEKRRVKLFTGQITVGIKPSRNSICYCGSGKKYKNCHWTEHSKTIVRFKN